MDAALFVGLGSSLAQTAVRSGDSGGGSVGVVGEEGAFEVGDAPGKAGAGPGGGCEGVEAGGCDGGGGVLGPWVGCGVGEVVGQGPGSEKAAFRRFKCR